MPLRYFALCLLLIFVSGCQTKWQSFNQAYASGAYLVAADSVWDKSTREKHKQEAGKLLEHLQGAEALRSAGLYEPSTESFDNSEVIFKHFDERFAAMGAADFLASLLVNDTITPYKGETYEKIMVNTYKALNFIALKNIEAARVELNRTYERQTRAVEEYAKEISAAQQAVQKKQQEVGQGNLNLSRSLQDPELMKEISKKYSDLGQWAVYPAFVNPFTTYLHGLFSLLVARDKADWEKAADFLKRSVGMAPGNRCAAADLAWAEAMLDGKLTRDQYPPTAWVIFENGLGPVKTSIRIDIPLFLVSDKVQYVGTAFPVLNFRSPAYSHLAVQGASAADTQVIGNMDMVVATEFNKDLPMVIIRAVMRTALQTYAQYELQKKYGDAGGLGMSAYQLLANNADTRIWSALPKDFQVARVAIPPDRTLHIASPQGPLAEIRIPSDGKFALVFLKIPQAGVQPVCHVTTFN